MTGQIWIRRPEAGDQMLEARGWRPDLEARSGGQRLEARSGGQRLEARSGGQRLEARSGGWRPDLEARGWRPDLEGGTYASSWWYARVRNAPPLTLRIILS